MSTASPGKACPECLSTSTCRKACASVRASAPKTTILYPDSPGAHTTVEPEADGVRIITRGPSGAGVTTFLRHRDALMLAVAILRAAGANGP